MSYDPARWPLAPGNASPDVEEALQAEVEKWPEPTAQTRTRIAQILRRSRLADSA
ncbi:hypothetical protein HOV42_gp46 [Gordonia phage Fairfaxidum]|uniref:Uncharacterized protein n=1 Tax=Gordonia phage Fairfaxidum TaxID=2572526 RepID=A0A4D6T6G0_9CAUD|nr:hypothetical protein HOV42_gp46 [Gordonia phage Fairfaxidum]QCG77629.1 hypothetical protein SEA_FAIRFAXIDUM_46 [Gordonia phage Fairfaxidum]